MAYEFLFANNATTTLAESVSATATVLNVSAGDGELFPTPSTGQAFAVTLVDAATGLTNEICYCTSRSGDALTVVRGQEGKNALAWSAGDTCANYITADVMESWLQESDLDGYLTKTVGDGRYVKQYTDDETYDVSQVGINKTTGDFVAYANGTWQSYQPSGDYATKTSISQFYPCGGSTTLTVPSWATRFEYILTGGGGGGSGCHSTSSTDTDTNTSGGGGGAGATAIGVISVSSSGSVSVTIGAGGSPESAGGASTIDYSGTNYATAGGGGSSAFPSIALSAGGSGGTASSNSGTNISGGNGSDGQNGRLIFAGNGGCSYWGGGGRAGAAGGISALPYGAGGGGAYDGNVSSIFYTGGYGASGFLLYRWLP